MLSNGAKLYIGHAHAVYDPTIFATETFTQVRQVETFGEFGPSANPITFDEPADCDASSWITIKKKGAIDYGSLQIAVGRFEADPGQGAMDAAALVDDDFAFRISLDNGETYDFFGTVLSARPNIGNADVVRFTYIIGINSPIY